MITADFEPKPSGGVKGVYATLCRVIPGLEGVFQITLLNVNNDQVTVNSRKFVGNLTKVNETVSRTDFNRCKIPTCSQLNIVHGDDIPHNEEHQLNALISKYSDIFASNPKEPRQVQNMTHRIITNDAQPVRMKPYCVPHA